MIFPDILVANLRSSRLPRQPQFGYQFIGNFIYKVGFKPGPCSVETSCLLAGIYADDGSFGFTASHNVFWMPQPDRSPATWGTGQADWFAEEVNVMGVFVNAGSRNIVRDNLVIESGSLYGSSGGFLTDGGTGANPPVASSSNFWEEMRSVQWNQPPFSTAYPALARMSDSCPANCIDIGTCPCAPFEETVGSNVGLDCTKECVPRTRTRCTAEVDPACGGRNVRAQ